LLDDPTMNFLARILLLSPLPALCVFLAGCTHADATRIGGPDSAPVFDVRCAYSMDHCYEKAAELCPSGYRSSDSGGYLRTIPSRFGAVSEFHGYFTAACKAAPAKVD
jgi:hypothetical protein